MTGSNNCTKQHYHCATCTFVVTLFMSVENSLRMLMTIVEVKIAYMSMTQVLKVQLQCKVRHSGRWKFAWWRYNQVRFPESQRPPCNNLLRWFWEEPVVLNNTKAMIRTSNSENFLLKPLIFSSQNHHSLKVILTVSLQTSCLYCLDLGNSINLCRNESTIWNKWCYSVATGKI